MTEQLVEDLGLPAPSVEGLHPDIFESPAAASAIRLFLSLTQSSQLLRDAGWSPEEIFWNRYYSFRRFVHLRSLEKGFDAGLEQEAHRLLEHPFPACDPDWSQLESVERLACSI